MDEKKVLYELLKINKTLAEQVKLVVEDIIYIKKEINKIKKDLLKLQLHLYDEFMDN